MINTVSYGDTVTNLRLSPNVSSSRNRLFVADLFHSCLLLAVSKV